MYPGGARRRAPTTPPSLPPALLLSALQRRASRSSIFLASLGKHHRAASCCTNPTSNPRCVDTAAPTTKFSRNANMNQKNALIGALTEMFGHDTVSVHPVTVPPEDVSDHPFCGQSYEVEKAIKDGAVSAVTIPSTLGSCYFFDGAGRLTGTLLVRDEFSTYFPGTAGA